MLPRKARRPRVARAAAGPAYGGRRNRMWLAGGLAPDTNDPVKEAGMRPLGVAALTACVMSLSACGGGQPAAESPPSADRGVPAPPPPAAAPSPAPAPAPAALTSCGLPRAGGAPPWSTPVDPFARWEANALIEPTAGTFEFAFDLAPPPPNAGRMALRFRDDCTGMALASGNNNGIPDGWGVLGARWTAAAQRWEAGVVAGLRREPPPAEYGVRLAVTRSGQFVAAQVEGSADQLRLARYRGIRADQIEPGPWDVEPADQSRQPRRLLDLVSGPGADQVTLAYAQPVAGDLVLQSLAAGTLTPTATSALRYPAGGEPRSAVLAFDGMGRAFIAWQQSSTTGGTPSYFRAWAASVPAGFAGAAEALAADLDSVQLAANADGGAVMSWRDLSTRELLVSRFCPRAGCWYPPNALGVSGQPTSALVARAGQVVEAVWTTRDSEGRVRLAAQVLPPDGSSTPGMPTLSPPLDDGAPAVLKALPISGGGLAVVYANASAVGLAHWSVQTGWHLLTRFDGAAVQSLRVAASADGSAHALWQRPGGAGAGWDYARVSRSPVGIAVEGGDVPVLTPSRGGAELAVSPDGTAWVMFARPVVLDAGLPTQRTVYRAAISYRVPEV